MTIQPGTDRTLARAVLRLLAGALVAGTALLATAAAASAHLDPDPAAVEAGTEATVGFVVEHGCDESPTVSMQIRVPAEITDAAPVAKDGWDASITEDVIEFTGGSLDAATSDTFEITFTAPSEPGPIYFPAVQTCLDGELAWIELPDAGTEELESPAPEVLITDGPPTADDLAGHEDDEGGGEGGHHEEEPAAEAAAPEGASATEDSGGVSGALIAAGLAAIAIVGVTALLVRRRPDTTG